MTTEPDSAGLNALEVKRRALRWDIFAIVGLVIASCAVFASSVNDAFVYDDERQIVQNPLIQDPAHFWRAMRSDVWAFHVRADGRATSNYWRPTFMLWLIAHDRLFGADEARPWHMTSVALHALVVALTYAMLRRLGLSRPVAAGAGLIFAVHPCHVESVAWISGCPDGLMSVFLLGAWLLFLPARGVPSTARTLGAAVCFAFAVMAKESAVLFPLVIAAHRALAGDRTIPLPRRAGAAVRAVSPMLVVVVLYFLGRLAVFGLKSHDPLGTSMLIESVLSAPAILAFYLRQCFVPMGIGPSHALRPVTLIDAGVENLLAPLAILAAVVALVAWRGRRDPRAWTGLLLFLGLLAPAMNVETFGAEHLVHERYLYLPLLGVLLAAAPALADGFARLLRGSRRAGDAICLAALVAASIPLTVQTLRLIPIYSSNLAIWERAVLVDPHSAFTWRHLGIYLIKAGRLDEAGAAFNRSMEIEPTLDARLSRAEVAIEQRRFADARRDLAGALAMTPLDWAVYDRIAVCYDRQGDREGVVKTYRLARDLIPHMTCFITERLSVALVLAGRRQEAMEELEGARARVPGEISPRAKMVLYRLGLLQHAAHRYEEARATLEEYLEASKALTDPETVDARRVTHRALEAMSGK